MDINQLKANVAQMKEIVYSQVQVRTNKLKPYVAMIEEAVETFAPTDAPEEKTPNTDPEKDPNHPDNSAVYDADTIELMNALAAIRDNYGITIHQALQTIEEAFKSGSPVEDEETKNENKKLKRKLTMFELKIAKLEQENKELKKVGKK